MRWAHSRLHSVWPAPFASPLCPASPLPLRCPFREPATGPAGSPCPSGCVSLCAPCLPVCERALTPMPIRPDRFTDSVSESAGVRPPIAGHRTLRRPGDHLVRPMVGGHHPSRPPSESPIAGRRKLHRLRLRATALLRRSASRLLPVRPIWPAASSESTTIRVGLHPSRPPSESESRARCRHPSRPPSESRSRGLSRRPELSCGGPLSGHRHSSQRPRGHPSQPLSRRYGPSPSAQRRPTVPPRRRPVGGGRPPPDCAG
jgi:hypothetical protein